MGRAEKDPRIPRMNPLRELAERPTKAKVDSILDRLDTRGVGRRQFVRLAAGSVAAMAAGGLAACSSSSGAASSGSSPAANTNSLSGIAAVTDGQIAMLAWAQGNEYPVEW